MSEHFGSGRQQTCLDHCWARHAPLTLFDCVTCAIYSRSLYATSQWHDLWQWYNAKAIEALAGRRPTAHAGRRQVQNQQLGRGKLETHRFQTGGIQMYVARSSSCGQTGAVSKFRPTSQQVEILPLRTVTVESWQVTKKIWCEFSNERETSFWSVLHTTLPKAVIGCTKGVKTASSTLSSGPCRRHFRNVFFPLGGLFRKIEEELIVRDYLGYGLTKREGNRTSDLGGGTFPKSNFWQDMHVALWFSCE